VFIFPIYASVNDKRYIVPVTAANKQAGMIWLIHNEPVHLPRDLVNPPAIIDQALRMGIFQRLNRRQTSHS